MAKTSQPAPKVALAPPRNGPSSSRASQAQTAPSKPKSKNQKKAEKENTKSSNKTKSTQVLKQNVTVVQPSIQKGKGIQGPETVKSVKSNSGVSTSNNGAAIGPSSVIATAISPSISRLPEGFSSPTLLDQNPKTPNCLAPRTIPKIISVDNEIFRLAAAIPVPISATLERQFYESQLLLHVLDKVRGEHKKRQTYYGELDQDETELRRSFIDKLAYICDFKKGGSTVTALALQKTYQGVTFWIAANDTVKLRVREFLQEVLQLVKNLDISAREATETRLLALIVSFNEDRLDYYWSVLKDRLPLCMTRLDDLEGSTDVKPSLKELRALKGLLSSLPSLSKRRVDLVRECFEARKRKFSAFETLAQLTASGNANSKFYDDIRHLVGRLGEHLKATKTIIQSALRFPAFLDQFEIQGCASPPVRCFYQSSHSISLQGMAGRIFTRDEEIAHYQEALEALQRTSNGALLDCLQQECLFKTRVHAELLLVDLFYWRQLDFIGDDPYIGCSKPACFNCFQYILAHPRNFVLPACHNKLYLNWRTPDIVEENVPITIASRIREGITSKMNSNNRAELRRQIDGRYPKRAAQYDSVTGTSSSIHVDGLLQLWASTSEDGDVRGM